MNDKTIIQAYINSFRKFLSPYLKPGIGISCKVFPAEGQGAILEFILGTETKNEDTYMDPESTINAAFKKIDQHMIGGNLDSVHFAGTNIYLEGNRIILIKAEDRIADWDNLGAQLDINRIVRSPK